MELRTATNEDSDGIIALIDGVLNEYGDRICLDGSEADLLDIEKFFFEQGGYFWVIANETNQIKGTHACLPSKDRPEVCNFKRLYLDSSLRGTDWSRQLMQVTIDWARQTGFARVEFWSDTRFNRAHKFFEKFDFQKSTEVRTMHDSFETYQEFFFYLELK